MKFSTYRGFRNAFSVFANRNLKTKMSVRRRKDPIHKIFQACSNFTPDAAWKEFLKECSYGRFPTGVKFQNNTIICARRKLNFAQEIPRDPEAALPIIINVFRDRLGIKTVREKHSEELVQDRRQLACVAESWSAIGTVGGKASAVRYYVHQLGIYYGMNAEERRRCTALIEIGIATKVLNKENIHVSSGRITEITGFFFDPRTREFSITGRLEKRPMELVPHSIDFVPRKQICVSDLYEVSVGVHANKMSKIPQSTVV